MKKRTAFIGAILSLIPLGQSFLIKTTVVFSTSAIISSHSEKVQAESASFYFKRGKSKQKKGDYQGAISDFTRAIKINPDYVDAYFERGFVKGNLEDYEGAISDFTKVIKINPEDDFAFNNRGFAKQNLEDYEGAISDFTRAIKTNPYNQLAFFNRALLKESLNDNKGALSDYTQVIKINSKDADAYWNRSIVKETIGDFRGVVDDQNKALKLYSKKKIKLSFKDIIDTSNLKISNNSLKKSVLKTAEYNGKSFQKPIKYFIHDKNEKINLREKKFGYEISDDAERFIVDTFLKIDSFIDLDFQRVYSPKEASIRIYKTKMPGDNIASTIHAYSSRKYGIDIIWGESEKKYPKLKKYPSLSADNAFSIVHEIGHALGLSHQESSCRKICKYNIDPNDKSINSRDTVMSYNNFLYPREVVFFTKFDIDALRNLWGIEKEN